jgi:hypothetical protein
MIHLKWRTEADPALVVREPRLVPDIDIEKDDFDLAPCLPACRSSAARPAYDTDGRAVEVCGTIMASESP